MITHNIYLFNERPKRLQICRHYIIGGSNYPHLKQIIKVPKVFEALKVGYTIIEQDLFNVVSLSNCLEDYMGETGLQIKVII